MKTTSRKKRVKHVYLVLFEDTHQVYAACDSQEAADFYLKYSLEKHGAKGVTQRFWLYSLPQKRKGANQSTV